MPVSTVLLDFSFAPSTLDSDHRQEEMLTQSIGQYVPQLTKVLRHQMDDGGYLLLFTGSQGIFVTVRAFVQGHLTVNIEYHRKEGDKEIFDLELIESLEDLLSLVLKSDRSKALPPIKRGCVFDIYMFTSDERLLEYDVDELVFEEKSPYQKIEIVHSKTLGNLLILDGLQNLSDRDLIYTETLMMRGQYSYEDKEIVILGGGDGALLYELLKENPKQVLMFELDEVVIKACQMHMRKCCGNVLDNLKGNNYEIIIGDCTKSLNAMVAEGKQFDYVFGDLTDVPVTSDTRSKNEVWDFIRLILNTSLKILKPSGKYLTHCCGLGCTEAAKKFEEHLSTLDVPVGFSTSSAFIPSFMEDWLFYQIWKKEAN